MTELETRLARMEERLTLLEDERAVAKLIASYGPLVDAGDAGAVAGCHSLMVVRADGQFRVHRATANHWRLRKGPDGWRVTVRTNRVLDGRAESPELLADGFREPAE